MNCCEFDTHHVNHLKNSKNIACLYAQYDNTKAF